MSDVFAGGAAKIKDRSANSSPQARRSFDLKDLRPTSTPMTGADEEESQGIISKFKIRGGAGASSSSRNTASGAPGAAEGAGSSPAQQPFASLFSRGSRSSTNQPRRTSPPPTPTSSGEQMPPPPIASQRRLPSTHIDTPRLSTSSSSTEYTRTAHSESEGDRRSDSARGLPKGAEKLGGRARSREHQQDKAAGAALKVGSSARGDLQPRDDRSNSEQPAETVSKRPSEEEDEEETPVCITQDRPTPSPMTATDEEQADELVMSGGVGTRYGGGGDESSEEESSSEEEDEIVLAGQEVNQVGIKREREYEESENESEYKRRDRGRRSPTETRSFVEYQSPDSHLQDDASLSYERQPQLSGFGFAPSDQQQQPKRAYATSNQGHYSNDPQRYLTTHQTQLDPLASVAELFPGTHPHLQQAQARLHAQHHSVDSESQWENCSLEDWKEGGDGLSKKFCALVGRVVTLVAKKSTRTDGFKQQMQEHRDELQQQATKLEGTKEGLSKWAAVVGLGGSG